MATRSPFYIVQEFLSPYLCEEIVDILDFNIPDMDREERFVKTTRSSERAEGIIYERLLLLLPELQAYYQFIYKGTESMSFEWFPERTAGQPLCGNAEYLRSKWLRTSARDFTGVIFFTDFQDKVPFEGEYEVFGGKLEFPQHHFGFNPQRGTLIVFPADPHFINATSEILAGDLFQVRFHIAANMPYFYMPNQFPGDYRSWFANIS